MTYSWCRISANWTNSASFDTFCSWFRDCCLYVKIYFTHIYIGRTIWWCHRHCGHVATTRLTGNVPFNTCAILPSALAMQSFSRWKLFPAVFLEFFRLKTLSCSFPWVFPVENSFLQFSLSFSSRKLFPAVSIQLLSSRKLQLQIPVPSGGKLQERVFYCLSTREHAATVEIWYRTFPATDMISFALRSRSSWQLGECLTHLLRRCGSQMWRGTNHSSWVPLDEPMRQKLLWRGVQDDFTRCFKCFTRIQSSTVVVSVSSAILSIILLFWSCSPCFLAAS